ncbi:hypothetical protein [Bartonella sp. ML70XJBT]|nr:hypothetical protein [Bartonella sp. ML70XJBT]
MKYSIACKFVSLGIPDEPIYNESQWGIVLASYKISQEGIMKTMLAMT